MTDAATPAPPARTPYVATALVLALVTFGFQWMMAGHAPLWLKVPYQTFVAGAFVTQMMWIVAIIFAFVKLGRRAWPALIGVPFALFWLPVMILLYATCGQGKCV